MQARSAILHVPSHVDMAEQVEHVSCVWKKARILRGLISPNPRPNCSVKSTTGRSEISIDGFGGTDFDVESVQDNAASSC